MSQETETVTAEVQPQVQTGGETGAEGSTAQLDAGTAKAGAKEGTSPSGDPIAVEADGEKPLAQYKPRDKFKVMVLGSDEQKEHDVPELLRSVMKDEKSEKEVIELLEKAYGLEPVKASRVEIRKERDHFKGEFTKVQHSIQDLRTTYQRGDLDAFLDKLQIPQERMLQWALDKVNYSQLPPEQQRVLDERREAQRRAWSAEQQAMTVGEQVQEQLRQAKSMLLDSGLARLDIKTFADAYDAKVGKPGAFKAEVIATGEYAWHQSGGKTDLTPEQAIQQVMGKWKPFVSEAQAATQADPGAATDKVVQPNQTRVIPNVQGRSSSPIKSKPRSIDDLRKIRDQSHAG